jgi:Methyltransferase small domain
MLQFDPNDPYPLTGSDAVTYREAQEHSKLVDEWLGLNTELVESGLALRNPNYSGAREEQHWIGLPTQTLLTPYTEIRFILSCLQPQAGDRIVDLGAGYGRMGFVIARHYPDVSFIGYEVVDERVAEGNRVLKFHSNPSVELFTADLSLKDFVPADAEFYFLYDFGSREAISKTLNDLREIAKHRSITVVGRGRASRDAIERSEPWLSQVNEPRHFEHFSIYRS